MITFPINPQQGQQYTPAGIPVTWQFDQGRNAWRVMRTPPLWSDIINKPATFPPADHEHEIEDVDELQNVLNMKQDITARGLPSGYAPLDETGKIPENMIPDTELGDWNDIAGKPSTFPPTPHSHPVVEISDSSSVGQQIVRAVSAYDVRQIIGAIGPDENARVKINKAGVQVGMRRAINFIEGSNITLAIADDVASEEVDVTINSSGSGGGGSSVIVSETKPAAPFPNDMWLDVATGVLFIYYNDGAKSQWIESIPYLSTLPTVFNKFVFPVAPTDGQTYEPIAGARWVWGSARGVWFASLSISGSYSKAEADAKFVDNAGDSMTGLLTLSANPSSNLHAATKQYVDAVQTSTNLKVAKAGDTMTGPLVLPAAAPTLPEHATNKAYVDGKPALVVSDTPPGSPIDGMLWWESDSGILYVRYNDGSGSQWVQAVALPAIDTTVFVAKAGDTMAGHLSLPVSPTAANAVRKDYVDNEVRTYAAPLDALAYNGMQINGSMEVSQERGVVGFSGNGYSVDGWQFLMSGAGVVQTAQYNVATGVGFVNVLASIATTAQASIPAGDYYFHNQRIEGNRTLRLQWGTAGAKPITICFWTGHVRPGIYSVTVRNAAVTRCYVATYTQNVANVYEYKTITIPGCTDGVWDTYVGIGIQLTFTQAAGSTLTAPAANTWYSGNYIAAPGQVNGIATTADVFRITGVCVIPGIYAPTSAQSPLIMRPFAQELPTCQRYWQKSVSYGVSPSIATGSQAVYAASDQTSPYIAGFFTYPIIMRAPPAITTFNQQGAAGMISYYWNNAWYHTHSITATSISDQGWGWYAVTNQSVFLVNFNYTLDSRL